MKVTFRVRKLVSSYLPLDFLDMFGPFHASRVNLGGLLWYVLPHFEFLCSAHLELYRKTPWKMSVTRKANQRKRLKMVDEVIETVRASGVKCAALVC